MLTVALLAEEAAGARALELVHRRGHGPALVLASPPDSPQGGSVVWKAAIRRGHEPVPASTVREPGFAARLRDLGVDVLLNVHSTVIVPAAVLEAPRIGAFNLHPGPLPRYAGLNAPSWAILRGEATHGVTVHRMDAGIDTGPIAYREEFDVADDATGMSLTLECVRRGLPLLARLLERAAADGEVPAVPQDPEKREYFGPEVPRQGRVPWSLPARRVYDFVRAFDFHPFPSPWGDPWTELEGTRVAIHRVAPTGAAVEAAPPGTVRRDQAGTTLVSAADEWLAVERLSVGGEGRDPGDVLDDGVRLG